MAASNVVCDRETAEQTAIRGVDFSPLHKAVFDGDLCTTRQLLSADSACAKVSDKYGNTPLHLAVMLGHKDIIKELVEHGAEVKEKNVLGWTALDEALSFGDKPTIVLLLKTLRDQIAGGLMKRREELIASLKNLGDFYAELKWEFHTWVPLLSRLLPSDVCKVHKTGCSIRLDSTLGDFSEMRWNRGDLSFIYNGEDSARSNSQSLSMVVLDNESKEYQHMKLAAGNSSDSAMEGDLSKHAGMLMKRPIVYANMSTQPITVKRSQSGWFFKSDKTETVGQYQDTLVYDITNLILITRRRREHLTPEQINENEALRNKFRNGQINEDELAKLQKDSDEEGGEEEEGDRRGSIVPPQHCSVTWEQYTSSSDGNPIHLGRPMDLKVERRPFKASVCMADECPVELAKLLDVLEVIVPYKHFHKLRQFVSMKLPAGFPVKLDMPVFPTVTATVTLQKFEYKVYPPSIFVIPEDYKKFVAKKDKSSSDARAKPSSNSSPD